MEISEFPLVDDVVAPTDTQSAGAHVIDFSIQRMLSEGWHRYLAVVREAVADLPDAAVREITTSFDSECHGGDSLRRGVRSVHRTRRSWVLEEALWDGVSDRLVAHSRVILNLIDRSTGRAAEIPSDVWSVVENLEGHEVPTIAWPT